MPTEQSARLPRDRSLQADVEALVTDRVTESISVLRNLLSGSLVDSLVVVCDRIVDAYRNGGKVIFFGNGGSAADAGHFAAELCGRFLMERRALPAIALGDNLAALTAIGNDYSFAEVFSRQIQAFGELDDVAVAISTSGQSENVLQAVRVANDLGLTTVALTGAAGGRLSGLADICVQVPSEAVARIQEAHTLLGHIICELVERRLFG